MSPWDQFRLRWRDLPDGSGGTSSCGDERIHDELQIEPGDMRHEVVMAVLAHDVERLSCVLNAFMRMNNGKWLPVIPPERRKRIEDLWNATRYK